MHLLKISRYRLNLNAGCTKQPIIASIGSKRFEMVRGFWPESAAWTEEGNLVVLVGKGISNGASTSEVRNYNTDNQLLDAQVYQGFPVALTYWNGRIIVATAGEKMQFAFYEPRN